MMKYERMKQKEERRKKGEIASLVFHDQASSYNCVTTISFFFLSFQLQAFYLGFYTLNGLMMMYHQTRERYFNVFFI